MRWRSASSRVVGCLLVAAELHARVSAVNTTDKYVTYPEGQETHEITRTTSLVYMAAGQERSVDFVSMLGTHRKTE